MLVQNYVGSDNTHTQTGMHVCMHTYTYEHTHGTYNNLIT